MSRSLRPRKKAPAGCLIPFGLIFLLAGLAVCWFSYSKILRGVAMVRSWTETPCRVTQWDVDVQPGGEVYQVTPRLAYEYDFQGRRFTGNTYDAAMTSSPLIHELEEQGAAARAGGAVCYVNPAAPAESSFRPGSYAAGGLILGLGLGFAGVGTLCFLSGIASLIRRVTGSAALAPPVAPGCMGGILAPVFFALFAAAGFAVWKLALQDQPDWKTIGGRMVAVPATIIASGVDTNRSGGKNKASTYLPKIAYSYEFQGRLWHSGWLDFNRATTSTGNYDKARDAAARYPAGAAATAWVDPQAPWQAVLEKQNGTRWWLWIFPIIFGGIGVVGLGVWLLKLTALGAALSGAERSSR